jgi:hypothetical protein
MKDLKALVKDVERELVVNLAISTKHNKVSFEDSKNIAKDYISSYPFANYEDLFERLLALSNKYREVRKIYVRYSPQYYEEKTRVILMQMRSCLRSDDIDEAVRVGKEINYARI